MNVEELKAAHLEQHKKIGRLRGERDGWFRATQAVDRYLCALVADGAELKQSHVETIAAIVADRDTLRARLSQIQGIAERDADGSPDAHPSDRAMARIVDLCEGKVTP